MFYRRQRKDAVMDCHYSTLTDAATQMLEQKPTSFFTLPPVVGWWATGGEPGRRIKGTG